MGTTILHRWWLGALLLLLPFPLTFVLAAASSPPADASSVPPSPAGILHTAGSTDLVWDLDLPLMPTARFGLAVAVSGGRIYAIGGFAGGGRDVVEEYDPATNTWTSKASMPTARSFLGAATASNGRIYAIGGSGTAGAGVLATVEEYDPSTNTWASKAPMPTARWVLAVLAAPNGKLYAIGGRSISAATGGYLATVEEYDPSANTWATKRPLPAARAYMAAAAASNGKVYVMGGYDSSGVTLAAAVEEYDPATDTWATRGNIRTPRDLLGAATGFNDRIYAVGGGPHGGTAAPTVVEEYDPQSDSWTARASLLTGRCGLGLAATSNGKLYAIGGASGCTTALAVVEAATLPAMVPRAPKNVTASAGPSLATVTWTAPASDGGSPITGYIVTASPGGITVTVAATATTASIIGLATGTYTFTVAAQNAIGLSPAAASNSITLASVPGAPRNVRATAGPSSATVTWDPPAWDGGSPVTGYSIHRYGRGSPLLLTVGATVTSTTLTGLTNGSAYRFIVNATNAVGTGAASSPSDSVVPATVPGAPTDVAATAGDGSAAVFWIAPASDGGSAITGYRVTVWPGGGIVNTGATQTSAAVVGLTNGTAYTFTVAAVNALGIGPTSAPSASVTPTADVTPPTTIPNVSPRPGWNKGDVTVTICASDAAGGSGVKDITYWATGAQYIARTTVAATPNYSFRPAWPCTAYTWVVIWTQGQTELFYFATDRSGNAGSPQSVTVKIDTTAPVVIADLAPSPDASGWSYNDVTVSLRAMEPLEITYWATGAYTLPRTSISGDSAQLTIPLGNYGVTTVYYSAADEAGNVSSGSVLVRMAWTPVMAARAWTAYGKSSSSWLRGSPASNFEAGGSIRYQAETSNNSGSRRTVEVLWWAISKKHLSEEACRSYIVYWSGNLEVAPGTTTWELERQVPNTACDGEYDHIFRTTDWTTGSGRVSVVSSKFSVGESPDITVTDMEVTQGIQNLKNEMPLVRDRETYVRAYVKSTLDEVRGVRARLRAFDRTLSELSGSPVYAQNNPITVRTSGAKRINLNDSFYFWVPPSWRSGEVTFRVEVNYDNAAPESKLDNNSREVKVVFRRPNVLQDINLILVPLHLHGVPTLSGDQTAVINVVNGLLRYYPVASVNWQYREKAEEPPSHGLGEEWDMSKWAGGRSKVVNRLRHLNFWTTDKPPNLFWVAMVPPEMKVPDAGGEGFIPGAESWVTFTDETWRTAPWYNVGSFVLAHEVGHNLGFDHMYCSGTEEGIDPYWPHPKDGPGGCSLAAVDETGFYGFDVYWDSGFSKVSKASGPSVISNNPADAPNTAYPFMGYKPPAWPSPYEYCLFFNVAIAPYASADCSVPRRQMGAEARDVRVMFQEARALQQASQYLYATGLITPTVVTTTEGTVTFTDGTASFQSVLKVSNPPTSTVQQFVQELAYRQDYRVQAQTPVTYTLAQVDAGGQVLSASNILLRRHMGNVNFSELVPLVTGTVGLQVRWGDSVLAERAASDNPPALQVLSPKDGDQVGEGATVRWSASDPDGDSLTFTVLYSRDNGQTWKPIGLNISGDAFQVSSLADLGATGQGKMRVIASDGFHTAQAESAGTFSVLGAPPRPTILKPTGGTVVESGRTVPLRGSASDVQDGQLTGDKLTWSSSLDGQLGTGIEVTARPLSPGQHQITLTVANSVGLTATTTITLTVAAATPTPTPTPLPTPDTTPTPGPTPERTLFRAYLPLLARSYSAGW